jgi:hypothetical protein
MGLYQSLRGQQRTHEMIDTLQRFEAAFQDADIEIWSSRF